MPSVNWKWMLVRSNDLGRIADLTKRAHGKSLKLMLNQPGTAEFTMNLEDTRSALVQEHTTALMLYRNGTRVWSGPIFKCDDSVDATSGQLKVTAMGWFELLNRRMVHTGKEWEEMITKSGEAYTPIATESAQQLYYGKLEAPFGVPMASIANDLLHRANIDVPTLIQIGTVAPTNSINFTVQQFAKVGEQITKLTAIESGFDFLVDPVTRNFNTYRNEIRGGIAGMGIDRGANAKFTYPGNCSAVGRTGDGMRTQNRTEAVGQYGIGKAESLQSINELGLFEQSDSLSEVTNINILIAFAASETAVLERPFRIVTFTPRPVNNSQSTGVPRPFEDYNLGDIVYGRFKKGPRFDIGGRQLQPLRVFGFTVGIDDNGIERISNIQTVYS